MLNVSADLLNVSANDVHFFQYNCIVGVANDTISYRHFYGTVWKDLFYGESNPLCLLTLEVGHMFMK